MELQDYNTDNYLLQIGKDQEGIEVYQVRNRYTGVVEYQDTLLSRTIDTTRALDTALKESMMEGHDAPADGIH